MPKDIIVNRDIIFSVSEKKGWVNIDVSKHNIRLIEGQQIALTLMTLDETNKDQFFIYAKMVSKNGLLRRDKALGEWKKVKGECQYTCLVFRHTKTIKAQTNIQHYNL